MGKCKDCKYYTETYIFWHPRICTNGIVRAAKLNGKAEDFDHPFYVDVSPEDSCNYFVQRPTMEDVGYTRGKTNNDGCFLTSACVEYLGKSDDCEELTTLRQFRDGYMAQIIDGKKLIDNYYEIAPKIVEKIHNDSKKDSYFQYIYSEIVKCIAYIKQSENQLALSEYINMVKHLQHQFKL